MTTSLAKTGFRSNRLDLGGGYRVHVEVGGRGAPLLLLHGFTGSTRTMLGVAQRLASNHRTIRVDLAGHGRSDVSTELARYRMDGATADLAQVLDRVLPATEVLEGDELGGLWNVPNAHVLGYSMGGRIALGLAAHHPERVRSLVLVSSSAGIPDPRSRARRQEADEELANLLLRDGIRAFVDRWMQSDFFETQQELGTAHWQQARAQRLENQPLGLALSLRGIGPGAQPYLDGCLPEVRVPVLLVVGERDPKFVRIAHELAERLPTARVEVVPGAGPAVHLEQPTIFADRVGAFLDACEQSIVARGVIAPEPAVSAQLSG